jgi:hypothetical protein
VTSKDYKRIILEELNLFLKDRQFKRVGNKFKTTNVDFVYCIELQSSNTSTSESLKFFINYWIGSLLLYKLEEKKTIDHLRGHFGYRISPINSDSWTVSNETEMRLCVEQVKQRIEEIIYPEFDKIVYINDLIEHWISEASIRPLSPLIQQYLRLLSDEIGTTK